MRGLRATRIVLGHARIFVSVAVGLVAFIVLPRRLEALTRSIIAWDIGCLCFLLLAAVMFTGAPISRMAENAEAQEEGEWTVFSVVVAGIVFSFAAILSEFSGTKDLSAGRRDLRIALVALTLILSWLVTHAVFALRYAHEYYQRGDGEAEVDGGLEFPSEDRPDYWDFFYFALVLGMTFQVSDVQITSRKLRRLATFHGFLGFIFNTVILSLTVNIASGLL